MSSVRRALVPFVLALLWIWIASPNARAAESARELADSCRTIERGKSGSGNQIEIPFTKKALLCWGYMQAMQELSVLVDQDGRRVMGACPPEDTTLVQLVRSFLTYARSHPDELRGNGAVAVIRAFQQSFPCSQFDPQPTGAQPE